MEPIGSYREFLAGWMTWRSMTSRAVFDGARASSLAYDGKLRRWLNGLMQ